MLDSIDTRLMGEQDSRSFALPKDHLSGQSVTPIVRLALFLIAIDLVVVGMFFLSLMVGLPVDLFDLDGELNLGAWWGGVKLMLVAAAIATVPLFGPKQAVMDRPLYWTATLGFAFLSADELLSLHERVTGFNKSYDVGLPMFDGSEHTGGAWIFVYLAVLAVLAAAFVKSIVRAIRRDPGSALLVGFGCAVFFFGAVVVEVMGYYGLLMGHWQVAIEEGLELIGVSILLIGCIRHTLFVFEADDRHAPD